jgi:flagellin
MMSLLTNTSAMNAVSSLASTQAALATTQSQISTGLQVSSAEDNAAYWSIATSMRSNIGALGAVNDSINLGASIVTTAYNGISASISVLNQMKNLVIDAQTAGVDTSTIDTQLSQLQAQLRSISSSASFNGINLLQTNGGPEHWDTPWTSNPAENIVTSFSQGSGSDSVGTTSLQLEYPLYGTGTNGDGTPSYGLMNYTNFLSTQPSDDFSYFNTNNNGFNGSGYSIDNMQTSTVAASSPGADYPDTLSDLHTTEQAQIEGTIALLTQFASKLGAIQSNLTSQGTFTQSLMDSLTSGVGSLVDADMNQASTRLNALQTQQQLGIQSLSIANNNSQMILKLFGG